LPRPRSRTSGPSRAARLLAALLGAVLAWAGLLALPSPAAASLDNDRYDGNIFALYAGNGSLVPPRNSLAEALAARRVTVLVFYLDDSSVSKRFSPLVSELQRLWGNAVELIPLVTDPLQGRAAEGPTDPASYWSGEIPQLVVLDRDGRVVLDASGQVELATINAAISRATGIERAGDDAATTTRSVNELNSEVVPSR
jgi:hypothetical protein